MDITLRQIVSGIDTENAVNIAVYITMSLFIVVVLMGLLVDKQNENKFISWFSRSLAANVVMVLAEAALCFFDGNPETVLITKICGIVSYCSGYFMAGFFGFCLVEFICETTKKVSHTYAYIVFSALLGLSAFVTLGIYCEIIIYFDHTGTMQYSQYYKIINIANFLIFASEVVFVFLHKKRLGRKTYKLSIFGALSIASIPLQFLWDTVPLYIAVSVSLLIMNNLFRNEVSDRLLKHEKKIAEIKVTSLINQMQPHFIFNTLNTIKYLCKTDAALARQTIDSYSVFLRGVIDSAGSERLVAVERELEVVRHYIFIETQRFGDILTLNTDIKEKNIFLPLLTIQPIVENAVKHGIRKKSGKGNITISTYGDADSVFVKIEDDGVGFDLADREWTDEKHVGIKNVSERIRLMTKGRLDIESTPGRGTTVVITIPRKVKN